MPTLEGKKTCRVTTPAGTDFHGLHRGAPGAGGHADQAARPDDGARCRCGPRSPSRRSRPHRRHRRRRRHHARHRPGRARCSEPHQLDGGGRQGRRRSRAATRPSGCARSSRASRTPRCIGEFAFGTSDKSPFGSPSEKGRVGTVHFALGDNHNAYPGGQNVCALHLDGVFLNATLEIEDDGTLHPQGRRVGALTAVSVVPLADVDPSRCPATAGAACCVTGDRVPGTASSLGYSVLHAGHGAGAGARTRPRSWRTCVAGAGELRLDDGVVGLPRPATRCTSRPASGTRSPTPATRTW